MELTEFEKRFPVPLNDQQRQAVRAVDGPTLLLAVPGSGKTTVLVARLGYMIHVRGIRPENILTVTYTVAATQDMRRRFASFFGQETADRMEFRTINGICARIILQYSRMIGKRAFSLVTDEKRTAGVLSQIFQDVEGEWPTEADLRDVRTQITYIKNMMLTEEEIRQLSGGKDSIGEIYRRYNRWLRDNRLMDYDDQMVYALTMLRRSPDLLAFFQDQYRYLCVDEAQDTSRIQHAILALLTSRDRNIFMVGDEDQSIYGFRAAFPEALTEFEKNYPGGRVLLMEENFRSTQTIVAMADRFIHKNFLRHEKAMRTSREAGAQVREIRLKGRRAQYSYLAKVAADCTGAVTGDERDRGRDGAPAAAEPARGRGPQTAVLYRNNESAVPLVDRLDREGIPFRLRNAEIGFFSHRTVMDIRAALRLSVDPGDTESFLRIYYKFNLYLRKEQAQRICERSREYGVSVVDAALGNLPAGKGGTLSVSAGGGRPAVDLPGEIGGLTARSEQALRTFRTHLRHMQTERGDQAVERIVKYMGYGDYMDGNGLSDGKVFILRTIGAETDSPAALLDRLDYLCRLFAEKDQDPSCPFILSTIHASKGLEYDTVYLMDVTDGIFPDSVPDDPGRMTPDERAAFEEERRVFYVGVTRAKNRLNVFTTQMDSVFADEFFGREVQEKKTETGPADLYGAREKPGAAESGSRSRAGHRGVLRPESAYRELSRRRPVSPEELAAYTAQLGEGLAVTHSRYGEGVVVSLDEDKVRILFDDRLRVFSIRALCAGGLLRF